MIEFNDYVQPNLALSEKELDANFFQHKPYLDTFSKEHKLNLAVLTAVHLEPMGVYSKSIKNVADLPDGAKIGSVTLSPRGDWRMPSDAVAKLWLEDIDK